MLDMNQCDFSQIVQSISLNTSSIIYSNLPGTNPKYTGHQHTPLLDTNISNGSMSTIPPSHIALGGQGRKEIADQIEGREGRKRGRKGEREGRKGKEGRERGKEYREGREERKRGKVRKKGKVRRERGKGRRKEKKKMERKR